MYLHSFTTITTTCRGCPFKSLKPHIFTSGLIALFIDLTRVTRYVWGGTRFEEDLAAALILSIPISFAGAWLAKRFLDRLPQKYFRAFVGVFLALVGVKLLLWN